MNPDRAWSLLVSQPVATLATIDPDGAPHLVPFTFAPLGEGRLVTAVDEKPKRSRSLRRLDNMRRDPRVAVLAHHYESDWSRLWWVRATGEAVITDTPPPGGHRALVDRYPPYAEQALAPWVTLEITALRGWEAG